MVKQMLQELIKMNMNQFLTFGTNKEKCFSIKQVKNLIQGQQKKAKFNTKNKQLNELPTYAKNQKH